MRKVLTFAVFMATSRLAMAMTFSDDPGVVCGSEEMIRMHEYEYDNSLPYTVFKEDPGWKGGASCSLNLIAALHPQVTLVLKHGAFCEVRIHEPEVEKYLFWVHCPSLTAW